MQPDARVPAIRGALAAAVVTAACLAAFGRTAGHAFLVWDDRLFITENRLIAYPSMASLLALWTTPVQDLYAPLTYTLSQLLSAVVGLTPWAFHLTNVLLHALNAWMVFGLLRQLRPLWTTVGRNWPPNLNRLCPSSRGCEVAQRQGVELAV
jgi:hypothetical protein